MSSTKNSIRIADRLEVWGETANSITFIVTEDCQLRCKYCYICGKNSFAVMSFETAKQAIDFVLEHREQFSSLGVVWDFIGGEPFLEIELIDKICDYIKIRTYELGHPWFANYRFNFSTNGLLYNDPRVQAYIEKNHKHLSIGISVDGTKQKHDMQRVFPDGSGSYDQVIQNIPLWSKQFEAHTKATIAHDDLKLVKQSVLHLWELGIKEVAMNVIFEDAWQEGDDWILEQQLKELGDEILERGLYRDYKCSLFDRTIGFPMDSILDNQNWCGAGRMLAIAPDGKFHPCVRFAQYSLMNKKEIVLGDVDTGYDLNKLRPFLALNRCSQSKEECRQCEVASGCAWCQGMNYDAAESETIYQRATYICKMHKAHVRGNNYFWNKLDKIVPPGEFDVRQSKMRRKQGVRTLIVLLDTLAASFCYYPSPEQTQCGEKMSEDRLKEIAEFALMNNLSLNLVVGDEGLTDRFREILRWNDYILIQSCGEKLASLEDEGTETLTVIDFEQEEWKNAPQVSGSWILRILPENLSRLPGWLASHSMQARRISVIIKDMQRMTEAEIETWRAVLAEITAWLPPREEEQPLELSIVTDRLMLDNANHCDAGVKHVTIAPDGYFYLCPGFYQTGDKLASLEDVRRTDSWTFVNAQLLLLENAPICKTCDAFHCKRCIYLNHRITGEWNTPSRQQCVCAHLERNASRDLIEPLCLADEVSIPEVEYLDPFDVLVKKNLTK